MNIFAFINLNINTFISEFEDSKHAWDNSHIRNNLTELSNFIQKKSVFEKDSKEEVLIKFFAKLIVSENNYYMSDFSRAFDGFEIAERLKTVALLIEKKAAALGLIVDSKPASDPVPAISVGETNNEAVFNKIAEIEKNLNELKKILECKN